MRNELAPIFRYPTPLLSSMLDNSAPQLDLDYSQNKQNSHHSQ